MFFCYCSLGRSIITISLVLFPTPSFSQIVPSTVNDKRVLKRSGDYTHWYNFSNQFNHLLYLFRCILVRTCKRLRWYINSNMIYADWYISLEICYMCLKSDSKVIYWYHSVGNLIHMCNRAKKGPQPKLFPVVVSKRKNIREIFVRPWKACTLLRKRRSKL